MIRSILRAYSRLIVFALGLLAGIQVPSFVDQYEKRIDAHYREVSANISGFRLTAEFLFEGDMQALVDYYRRSNDEVFQRDGDSIELIVQRYDRIDAEREALLSSPMRAALHVALASDPEFFDETLAQYSYTVPLNWNAVQWGVLLALFLTVMADLSLLACVRCVKMVRQRRLQRHDDKRSRGHRLEPDVAVSLEIDQFDRDLVNDLQGGVTILGSSPTGAYGDSKQGEQG